MADLARRAVAVIGHGFDNDCNAGGAVAFIDDLLVVIGVACAQRLVDSALNVIVGHVRSLCLGDDRSQTRVVVGIAAAALF